MNKYAKLSENNDFINRESSDLKKDLLELDTLLTDQESELNTKDETIKEMHKKILSLESKSNSQREEVQDSLTKIEETKLKMKRLEQTIVTIRKKNDELRKEKDNANSTQKNTTLEITTRKIQKNIDKIKELEAELQNQIALHNSAAENANEELTRLSSNNIILRNLIDQLRAEIELKDAIRNANNNIVPKSSTEIGVGTNVMTSAIGTQTEEEKSIERNSEYLIRKIHEFGKLLLYYEANSEKIHLLIKKMNELLKKYDQEGKTKLIIPHIKEIIILRKMHKFDKNNFLLNLNTKQINAILNQLKKNFYNLSDEQNEQFKQSFQDLYGSFNSMIPKFAIVKEFDKLHNILDEIEIEL